MEKPSKNRQEEYENISKKIDRLLADSPDFDLNEYTPLDTDDDGVIYHNYSNGYGGEPSREPPKPAPSIPAYNGDVAYGAPKAAAAPGHKKRRRRGCCGCGCAGAIALVLALVIGISLFLGSLVQMPKSEESLGRRKPGVATVLLCGTDADGTRTDTMMLIYLDTKSDRVGLLSLPRDTLTRTDEGRLAKLNAAYGRNGCGEQGMDWVMEYVRRTIGYRPDGYILVDMELVPKVVDLMGGVDVYLDHHIRVETNGVEVYVDKGQQHLNGAETLATLRYRYGYSNADLGRVQVQRKVIKACMEQWVTPANLGKFSQVMDLIEEESLTDLELRNFLWVAQAIVQGMGDMSSDTLPGYAQMRNKASYYILKPQEVADLINASYNPYEREITLEDLTIEE